MKAYIAVLGGGSFRPGRAGSDLKVALDGPSLRAMIANFAPRAIVVEVPHFPSERFDLVASLGTRFPGIPRIVVAHHSSEESAVAALRAGAADYLRAPVTVDVLNATVERLVGSRSEDDSIIGEHSLTRGVLAYLRRVAATSSTVLITGETGTGKELAARFIHRNSSRGSKPFVSVNCAAVPDTLLESELFGHVRGSFTGAHASADGKFQQADGGTLFLDEIGDMSALAQAKILRVLESREVWRIGGSHGTTVNVRIVAATNQALEQLVSSGRFRSDLYYRLNVARLRLPALRERRSDIPLLVDHYVDEMNKRFGASIKGFTNDSMDQLKAYDWPGNVRELKNMIEAAFIELPPEASPWAQLPQAVCQQLCAAASRPTREQEELLRALKETRWNVSRAAERLHVSRMTLYRKIARYGIARDV
jgi:DNA-binding NtrC family response regulator